MMKVFLVNQFEKLNKKTTDNRKNHIQKCNK